MGSRQGVAMKGKDRVTESSGNVFADLGFEHADQERMKADLVRAIRQIIRDRKLTQVQAAKLLNVSQPKCVAIWSAFRPIDSSAS